MEISFSVFKHFIRPLIFFAVLVIHVVLLLCLNFNEGTIEKEDENYAEIFKLVDVEEFVPPPPQVVEKKQQVVIQPKASENVKETEEDIIEIPHNEEPDYLPQHKISSIPEIPTKEILSKIEYPQMALRQGNEGVVYLELFIDQNGYIRKINILKNPGFGFAEAALKALEGIVCKPAMANGKPCAVKFRYPVRFTVK